MVTTKTTTRKRSTKGVILNLETVDPRGRVDVLAARVVDRVVRTKCSQFAPLLDAMKPMLHHKLNRMLGPKALPVEVKRIIEQMTLGAGA